MSKRLIAFCTAVALLSACSSPPKLDVPNGRTRTAVNSQAAIDEYTTRTTGDLENARQQTNMSRQLETMKYDVAELKAYMLALAAQQEEMPKRGSGTAPSTSSAAPPPAFRLSGVGLPIPTQSAESIKVRDKSIIFRVTHGVGLSTFSPSTNMKRVLLQAAQEAHQIEIFGGSDASVATPANLRVAKARAENACQYLIRNGIAPDKVRTKYLAAGGFITDNSTPEGKAKNRRVDIEVMDLNTEAYKTAGKPKTGATQ
jgi:outer membrane protein OmpA-like peptidoglycan-associated protein